MHAAHPPPPPTTSCAAWQPHVSQEAAQALDALGRACTPRGALQVLAGKDGEVERLRSTVDQLRDLLGERDALSAKHQAHMEQLEQQHGAAVQRAAALEQQLAQGEQGRQQQQELEALDRWVPALLALGCQYA